MRQFWYLTKGKLNERGTDLRVFSKPPKEGTPFIGVDFDHKKRVFKFYDDNNKLIREYKDEILERDPHQYRDYLSREYPDLRDVIYAELNKMKFERGSSGEEKIRDKTPYRIIDDYIDRKKKSAKTKSKRKPKKVVKKCKCK